MTGKGHPLPGSNEARHNEIPEHLAREKGRGDDPRPVIQPDMPAVAPDGEAYRYDDLGRGPGTGGKDNEHRQGAERANADDEVAEDQAAHQDRGQSIAEEAERD